MYYRKITADAQANARLHNEMQLRGFLAAHSEALANSAALLAGVKGARIVHEINDAIADGGDFTRRIRHRIGELLDILKLENVHDDSGPEAGCFAAIDPCDPVVEAICLLADGLAGAIRTANLETIRSVPEPV